jgi:hypothetical protein
VLWGGQERLRELWGPEVVITAPRRSFVWRFPSAEHQVAFLASFHGPTVTALQTLAPDRAGALKAELDHLLHARCSKVLVSRSLVA